MRDSASALKTIFADPCLKIFVPCALILNLLAAGPLALMMPFCLEKGFAVEIYGVMMTVWTAGMLICTVLLGIIKLSPKVRFWVMAIGFSVSEVFLMLAYLSGNAWIMGVFAFIGAFLNAAGNSVFNASLMLALPEENRGAILGFISSASVGGTALSTLMYGFLGDVFPLYLVFAVGSLVSLIPMLYMCFHPRVKEFVISH